MAEKSLDLTNYTKIKTIDHLSKIYRHITNGMLVAIPLIGIVVYVFALRSLLSTAQIPWYIQLAIGVIVYPLNCVLHELLHGYTYLLFNPGAKVTYRFGVLGSATHIEGGYVTKWPFLWFVLAPMTVLSLVYLLLAVCVPSCFAVLYFTAVIQFTSGSNDMLLAFPQFGLKKSDVLIDGENGFEVYRIQ